AAEQEALQVVRVIDGKPVAPFQAVGHRLGLRLAAEQPDPDALIPELPDGHTLAARAWRADGPQDVDLVSLATPLGLRLDWSAARLAHRLPPSAAPQGQ